MNSNLVTVSRISSRFVELVELLAIKADIEGRARVRLALRKTLSYYQVGWNGIGNTDVDFANLLLHKYKCYVVGI